VGVLIFWDLRHAAIVRAQWRMAAAVPGGDVYPLYLRGYAVAPLLMAAVALLPVGACVASLRGRRSSTIALLTLYGMTQLALSVIYVVAAVYLVGQGAFSFTDAAGATQVYRVAEGTVRHDVPITLLPHCAPLLAMSLLLIPAVRRAFLPAAPRA
jgi:hypothetical protein